MEESTALLAAGSGMAIVVIWLAFLTVGTARAAKRQKVISTAAGSDGVVDLIRRCLDKTSSLDRDIEGLRATQNELRELLGSSIRKVGLVRFDAFDDVGGELSFALALLDETGNGIVINTINGREDSRTYAKYLTDRKSSQTLSPEEKRAVAQALSSGDSNNG